MNFYLPDFTKHLNLNLYIIKLLKEHPEYFYDYINIGAIYGAFGGSIWNGGRVIPGIASKPKVKETIEQINNLNIPIRFTYTNHLLTEEDLHDRYCNMTLDIANNGINEIIVNSPLLEDYLKNKYPNFKYILSTTRCERDINKINEATKLYDLVVIDYRDNSNLSFLLGIEDKSKIEILINAYCNPDCPIRKDHYDTLARIQLNYGENIPQQDKKFDSCPTYNRSIYDILDFPTVLTNNDIQNVHSQMGFSHYKIEGRTISTINLIESYIYYFIKPEWKDRVRIMLLKNFVK